MKGSRALNTNPAMNLAIVICRRVISAAILAAPLMTAAAPLRQSVNSAGTTTEWNDPIWGSGPATAPTDGSGYETASGLTTSSITGIGPSVTGRVRAYGGSNGIPTFAGDSLTIVPSTELLIKDPGATYDAHLVLKGGVVRFAPNSGGGGAALGGMIDVAAESYLGVVQQSGGTTLTVGSTLIGANLLHVAGGDNAGNSLVFSGDLSGFSGILNLGGGNNRITVGFSQAAQLPAVDLRMGDYSSADRLDLSHALTFKSFAFAGSPLAPGSYTAGELNVLFGNGSQFLDNGGSLTVIQRRVLPKIFIIGDSTVKNSGAIYGWGQTLHHYLKQGVTIVNHANPGESSKTFISENRWAATIAGVEAQDYVLIQFGHNDSHHPDNFESTDANDDYKVNLQQFIDDTRAKGATPVMVTPMHRRSFDAAGNLLSYAPDGNGYAMDLAPYAAATKQVATANAVPCIDLFTASGTYMGMLGDEACKKLLAPGDITHWNELGACAMASMVAAGLSEVLPIPVASLDGKELHPYLRSDVIRAHQNDLGAGVFPRPVFTMEWEGDHLRLDWFLQPGGAVIQRSANLESWTDEYSGAAGSVVVSPDGARGFCRVMSP